MDATLSDFLNIIDAMLQDLLFVLEHHCCAVLRSSVQLSNIIVSTLYDLLFKFLPSLMLGRSCLQFANMGDATLQDPIFHFKHKHSTIVGATLEDLLCNFPTSWMLHFKIFS